MGRKETMRIIMVSDFALTAMGACYRALSRCHPLR